MITDVRRKADLPCTTVHDRYYFTDGLDREVAPWLYRLVAGLSPLIADSDPTPVHVGFVLGKVALGPVFLRVSGVSACHCYPTIHTYYLFTYLFIYLFIHSLTFFQLRVVY